MGKSAPTVEESFSCSLPLARCLGRRTSKFHSLRLMFRNSEAQRSSTISFRSSTLRPKVYTQTFSCCEICMSEHANRRRASWKSMFVDDGRQRLFQALTASQQQPFEIGIPGIACGQYPNPIWTTCQTTQSKACRGEGYRVA